MFLLPPGYGPDSYLGDIGLSAILDEADRIMGVVWHERLKSNPELLKTKETVLLVVDGSQLPPESQVVSTGPSHRVWHGSDANFGWILNEEGGYARMRKIAPNPGGMHLHEVLRKAAQLLKIPEATVPARLAFRRRVIEWDEISAKMMKDDRADDRKGWRVKYNSPAKDDTGLVGFWIQHKDPGTSNCLGWIARGPNSNTPFISMEGWQAYEYGNQIKNRRASDWFERGSDDRKDAPNGVTYLEGTCKTGNKTRVTQY